MYYIALVALYVMRENGIIVPIGVIAATWIMFAGSLFVELIKYGNKQK